MAETWKGWTTERAAKDGVIGFEYVFATKDKMLSHTELGSHKPHPVLVTPIDESLPHPGDGKEWETAMLTPVEVLSVPVDGRVLARLPKCDLMVYPVHDLRERKPEPEHEEWCSYFQTREEYEKGCTCERRSGEDRRKGERRTEWAEYSCRNIGGRRERGQRRSGTDRRSP